MRRRLSRYANVVRDVQSEQWRLEVLNDEHERWSIAEASTRAEIEERARDFARFSGYGVTFYGRPFIEREGKSA